jgi:hypothetical protein
VIDLRARYDQQVRTSLATHLPAGHQLSWDGPLMRVSGGHQGFVGYRDLAGTDGPELDALIERTIGYFADRAAAFEWKWHAHDQPADLAERLEAHGFRAGELETVLIGEAAGLSNQPPPAGLQLRELVSPQEFAQVARMQSEVWDEDWGWLAEDLAARRAADGDLLRVFGAFDGQHLVSAAWVNFNPGTDFAGLWGGSTLPGWRGRGAYRALVEVRARLAAGLGYRYLQVDASPDSNPILQRLGFVPVATTRPYLHGPG